MTGGDLALFLGFIAVFVGTITIGGLLIELDELRQRRQDAQRRNHVRRPDRSRR